LNLKRVSLRESIYVFGDLPRPRYHKAFRGNLELRRKLRLGITDHPPIEEDKLTRYINEKFDAERRVLKRAKDGELVIGRHLNGGKYKTFTVELLEGMEFDFDSSIAREPGRKKPLRRVVVWPTADAEDTATQLLLDAPATARNPLTKMSDKRLGKLVNDYKQSTKGRPTQAGFMRDNPGIPEYRVRPYFRGAPRGRPPKHKDKINS
jgi:hypothetical protein